MGARTQRVMRLSGRHVAAVTREVADPGPGVFPGRRPATEADYDQVVGEIMAGAPPGPFWLFGYGSLIWNPAFDHDEARIARVRGWRRSFCLGWDRRFRGNAEQPGLMMALDRGGECTGVAYRLPVGQLKANLDRLLRREMSLVPSGFPPRWINAETSEGRVRALVFAVSRTNGAYIRPPDDNALADVLATACGYRGSMAEYLFATVAKLEELGIHDRHLWKLQQMVAERIERTHGLQEAARAVDTAAGHP